MGQNDSKPSTPEDGGGRRPSNTNLNTGRTQQQDFARLIEAAPPRSTKTTAANTGTRYTGTTTTAVRQPSESPRAASALSLLRSAAELKGPSTGSLLTTGPAPSGSGGVDKNPVVYLETGAATLNGTEVVTSAGTQSGNLRIGDRVVWLIQGSAKKGKVQKLVVIRGQVVAGVEFDTPWILNGSGYLQFKMMFICGENRGAWISLALLIREQDYYNQGTSSSSAAGSATSSTGSAAAASTRKERIQASNLPSSKPSVPTPPAASGTATGQSNSSASGRQDPNSSATTSRPKVDRETLRVKIQGLQMNLNSNINASVTVSTSSGAGGYTFTATTTTSNNTETDRAPKAQKPIPAQGSTSNQSNASNASSQSSTASGAKSKRPPPPSRGGKGGGGPPQKPKPPRPLPPQVNQPSTSATQRTPDLYEQIEAFRTMNIQDPAPSAVPGPSREYQGGHTTASNINVYTPLTVANSDEEEEQQGPRNSNGHHRGGRGAGRGQRGTQRFNRGKNQHHPYARGSHNSSSDSNGNQSPQRGGNFVVPRGRGGHHRGGHSGEGGQFGGRGKNHGRGRGRGQRGGNNNFNNSRDSQNRHNGGDPNRSFEASGDFTPNANTAPQTNRNKASALECPVCFEGYQVPVYQCLNGHQICSICVIRVNECPQCRVEMDPEKKIRCLVLDKLLKNESLG